MKSGWRNLVDALWRRPIATLNKSAKALKRWFDSPLGSVFLEQQRPLINSLVEDFNSDTMLMVSPSGAALLGSPNDKRPGAKGAMQIHLCSGMQSLKACKESQYSLLVSDLDAIPLMDNSVDFVLLHHTLEFSRNPHQVLRETTRILAPGGNLVIVGFNRWSFFGLRRCLSLFTRASAPWAHHPLSSGRLIDWMHLMSCEPIGVARGFYGLPMQSRRGMRWFKGVDDFLMSIAAPGGSFYMLHASKRLFGRSQQRRTLDRAVDLIRIPVPSAAARLDSNFDINKSRPRLRMVKNTKDKD